ncbi:MAG: Holliday junction branch migration protein RuvA [Patescibacteria group bacterium]|jgi:Holliday junction DNA helicase RuvA
MLYYISGKITKKSKSFIILDLNGLGYKIFTDPTKINSDEIKLFIHESIKEDTYDLYGFQTEEELKIFESLISVNGVGPKVGLAIMTNITPDQIIEAIEKSNIAIFKSVSGVGNKVAGKIIIELKSKFENLTDFSASDNISEVLTSLGYKQQEIINAIKQIPSNLTEEDDKIKWMIKNIKKS